MAFKSPAKQVDPKEKITDTKGSAVKNKDTQFSRMSPNIKVIPIRSATPEKPHPIPSHHDKSPTLVSSKSEGEPTGSASEIRRPRREASISKGYAEPSLRMKMRRGDDNPFIIPEYVGMLR